MITVLHRGGYAQMITILHGGGALGTPKSDYVICARPLEGIMPIITCRSCNSTNTRFCHEKGFVENTHFSRKTGSIANTCFFGFVWCRVLRRHLGFDSDFAQISGLKIGGWQHWYRDPVGPCMYLPDKYALNALDSPFL